MRLVIKVMTLPLLCILIIKIIIGHVRPKWNIDDVCALYRVLFHRGLFGPAVAKLAHRRTLRGNKAGCTYTSTTLHNRILECCVDVQNEVDKSTLLHYR